jgi:hypothetical protein
MSSEIEYKERYKIAKATSTCIWCKERVEWFGDTYSRLEYTCSALCKKCQGEFFSGGKL